MGKASWAGTATLLVSSAEVTVYGNRDGEEFGAAVGVGNVNGDAYGDLMCSNGKGY
eukprot:CAMPEP_0114162302 /NCGR_PEP_ID=MMETSP0043_2-20121206/29436_1 /TAXON_ID=464988 /ORGANISM="Hemiselmis andersenii, Strain CCMP644" /LENGTH=55 /DNA_ID=CAMNT_0001258635 /DNA_START=12 /DNA_END=176 /DNA_ORIENTATION=+